MIRLTEIKIDGYGIYRDFVLADLSPGLNVVVGDNEAGKSTFHSFVVNVLFGFLDRRHKVNQYDPVDGGPKGGRVVLEKDGEGPFIIERDASGGTVRYPDGTEGGDDAVTHLLGGTSRDVFEQVFAFSLRELQELDLLGKDQIKNAIYSAGMGANALRVVNAGKTLADALDELYRPRARKLIVNALLKEFEDTEKSVRSLRGEPEERLQLKRRLESDDSAKAELTARNTLNRARLDAVRRLSGAWNDWIALQNVERALGELPDTGGFPVDGAERLERASRERRHISEQLEERRAKLDAAKEKLSGLEFDSALFERVEQIEELAKTVELHKQERADVDSLQRDVAERSRQIERDARELGSDWTEEKVASFDLSISFKRRIQDLVRRLGDAENDRKEALVRVAEAKKAVKEIEGVEKSLAAKLAELEDAGGEAHADRIDRLDRQLDIHQRNAARVDLLRRDLQYREGDVERLLSEVGGGWDSDRLEAFEFSLDDAERLEAVERRFNDLARERAGLERAVALESERAGEVDERLEALAASLDGAAELDSKPDADELKRKRVELRRLRAKWLQAASGSRDGAWADFRWWSIAGPLVLIGLVSLGVGPMMGLRWSVAATVCGLMVGLGVVVFLFGKRRGAAPGAQAEGASMERRATSEGLRGEIVELARGLGGIDEAVLADAGAWDRIEEAIEERFEARRERDAVLARRAEMEREAASIGKRLSDLRGELDALAAREAVAATEWRAWLVDNGFPETFAPGKARDVARRLTSAKATAREARRCRGEVESLNGEMETYRREAEALSELFGIESNEGEEVSTLVKKVVSASWAARDAVATRLELERDRAKAGEELTRRHAALRRRTEEFEKFRKNFEELSGEWRRTLEEVGLSADYAPEVVGDVFHKVETTRAEVDAKRDRLSELRALRDRVEGFQRAASNLGADLNRPVTAGDDVVRRVEEWAAEARRCQNNQAIAEGLRETIEDVERESRAKARSLREVDEEISSLYGAAGVADEEEFRRQSDCFKRRAELEDEKRERTLRLLQACGDEAKMEEFATSLAATTLEALDEERASLEAEIHETDSELGDVSERIGERRNELRRLEASRELSDLVFEREKQAAKLEKLTRRWCVLRIAALMIDAARRKYERERRPDVVKEAETYFATLTGGSYPRLLSPLGEETIKAVNLEGRGLEVDQLSRGAAEQLYLALRFGFIKEYARKAVALPLFFDDVLVNFDPTRTRRAAELIYELSGEHQIFMFTCHPGVVEAFAKTKSQTVNYLNLSPR